MKRRKYPTTNKTEAPRVHYVKSGVCPNCGGPIYTPDAWALERGPIPVMRNCAVACHFRDA